MPVVVTGDSWLLRRVAVEALARTAPEVRVWVEHRSIGKRFRELGAKVAVGAFDDVDTLATVMDGAHTVCHVPLLITESGEMTGDVSWNEKECERFTAGSTRPPVEAAREAGIQRFILVSYPGANQEATNPYLRGLGEAEAVVASSGIEHVVVRCTHVYDPGSEWIHRLAESGGVLQRRGQGPEATLPGSGHQLVAPVDARDVAGVLAAADDRERIRSGTYGLEG